MRLSNEESSNPNLVTHYCSAATMRFFLNDAVRRHFQRLGIWEEVRTVLHDFCQAVIINVNYKETLDLQMLRTINGEFTATIAAAMKTKAYQGFGRMIAEAVLKLNFSEYVPGRYGNEWTAMLRFARALMFRAALLVYLASQNEQYLEQVRQANARIRKAW